MDMDTILMLFLIGVLLCNALIIVRSCAASASLRGRSPVVAAIYSLLLCGLGAYLLITTISEGGGGDGWVLGAIFVAVPDFIALFISRRGEITQDAREAMEALNAQIPANDDDDGASKPHEEIKPQKLEKPCTVTLKRVSAFSGVLVRRKMQFNGQWIAIGDGEELQLDTIEPLNYIMHKSSVWFGCLFPATSGGMVKLFCNANGFLANQTVLQDSQGNDLRSSENEECHITVIREHCFNDDSSAVPIKLDKVKQGKLNSGEVLRFISQTKTFVLQLGGYGSALLLSVNMGTARNLRLYFNNEGILHKKTVMSDETIPV
jgi:hypothetical protein